MLATVPRRGERGRILCGPSTMSSSEMSSGSGASVSTAASGWGGGDPGLGMTGVHLRVLGGRSVWPLTFHELMVGQRLAGADFTPEPLGPRTAGAYLLNRVLRGDAVDWTTRDVPPGEVDCVLAALGLETQVLNVRDAALAPMRELHKLIQQPVNLSMRQGDEIVYIERAYSERSGMQVVRAIGGRAPLHLTSVGKLFLAADDPQRVRAYATRTGLQGNTRNSLTQVAALERELSVCRQLGVARDNEELELGVRCMAAGIYDDQNKLVAGLSISAPADSLDEGWLPKLKATAASISTALGNLNQKA